MKAYSLVKDFCPEKNTIEPGTLLGDGFHGEVFEITSDPNKVVKYSCVSDAMVGDQSLQSFFENLSDVLDFQKRNDYACFVQVFDFGLLHSGKRVSYRNRKESFILYYMVMEKLFPLTSDEKKLFKTICDAYEQHSPSIKKIVNEQADWLSFDKEKVFSFLNQFDNSPIVQNDFQRRNIMKDREGNYKIIDFDYSELYEENSYEISRFECAE